MCGISGYSGAYTSSQLEKASALLRHRGPDASGCFIGKNAGLAHRRLSILDLSSLGSQPYYFEDLVLVFNGELYNYKDVKDILLKEGYSFISNSDTEVLIKAFHCWGVKAVERFIGMFAFAIYNCKTTAMYLFRDRLGVKPLYYTLENGLAFSSELKAVLPFIDSNPELDPEAIWEYFRMGYISGEKSIYQNVRKLLPGCYMEYKDGNAVIEPYWKLKEDEIIKDRSIEEWKDQLHELMIDAFKLRMVSDVPVGVFLSGGVDSSLVSAVLQGQFGNINSFTIGFDDPRFNEAPYAKKVAAHLGTNHTEVILNAAEAFPILEGFYDVYDEPFADTSGIPSVLISRVAKKSGMKVVLSADGGDELFMGYNHYNKSALLFNKLKKIPISLKTLSAALMEKSYSSGILRSIFFKNAEHKISALSELLKKQDSLDFYNSFIANQSTSELRKLLNFQSIKKYREINNGSDIQSMTLWDLYHYLPDDLLVKMDRATMYNSIEGREPFLDHRLVEFAFQMPSELKSKDGVDKWIIKEILTDYLPRNLFERPKKGFSIPLFEWFRSDMDHLFEYYLNPRKVKQVEVLNSEEVKHEYEKYKYYKQRGKDYNIEKMWRILSFIMWWDRIHKPLD